MSRIPDKPVEASSIQTYFEQMTTLVPTEFQVEEASIEHDTSAYYLKQPQETKQAFFRLVKSALSIFLAVQITPETFTKLESWTQMAV